MDSRTKEHTACDRNRGRGPKGEPLNRRAEELNDSVPQIGQEKEGGREVKKPHHTILNAIMVNAKVKR